MWIWPEHGIVRAALGQGRDDQRTVGITAVEGRTGHHQHADQARSEQQSKACQRPQAKHASQESASNEGLERAKPSSVRLSKRGDVGTSSLRTEGIPPTEDRAPHFLQVELRHDS